MGNCVALVVRQSPEITGINAIARLELVFVIIVSPVILLIVVTNRGDVEKVDNFKKVDHQNYQMNKENNLYLNQ